MSQQEGDEIVTQMRAFRLGLSSQLHNQQRPQPTKFDWRALVRQTPWASLAGAVAAGFLLVPRSSNKSNRNKPAASGEGSAILGLLLAKAGEAAVVFLMDRIASRATATKHTRAAAEAHPPVTTELCCNRTFERAQSHRG